MLVNVIEAAVNLLLDKNKEKATRRRAFCEGCKFKRGRACGRCNCQLRIKVRTTKKPCSLWPAEMQ